MDAPTAYIVSVDGPTALLRVDAAPACARCAAGKGCGAGLLTGQQAPRELRLPLPADGRFASGDRVLLEMQPAGLLQASVYAYGLPLMALTLVPLLANALWGPFGDGPLAGLALVAVAAAVAAGRLLLRREPCLQRMTPSIAGPAPTGDA
jgi:positive regulator of sigma E activity